MKSLCTQQPKDHHQRPPLPTLRANNPPGGYLVDSAGFSLLQSHTMFTYSQRSRATGVRGCRNYRYPFDSSPGSLTNPLGVIPSPAPFAFPPLGIGKYPPAPRKNQNP